MIAKSERTKAIERLETVFGTAKGIYLTDINRINGEKMSQLRGEFRKNGLTYIVVKNSLARIALERVGKNGLASYFVGPVGVALAEEEATVPARVIKEFRKVNKNILDVKIALVDGTVFTAEQAEQLADIPSKEVLLSQLLSCLQAPMTNFAGVLNGIMGKLVGTLDAVKTKKESEGQ